MNNSEKCAEKVSIHIGIENGQVTCHPDPAYADYGEEVVWECEYPFSIHFGHNTPVDFVERRGRGIFSGTIKHDPEVAGGRYAKYTIALFDGKEVLISDPGLIVPRRG